MQQKDNINSEESKNRETIIIRMSPQQKAAFVAQAAEKGLSVSEFGASILNNQKNHFEEIKILQEKCESQVREIENLNEQLNKKNLEPSNLLDPRIVAKVKVFEKLFGDKRLNELFNQLKGKRDVVVNENASPFPIVYQTPYDVLIALIYSTKIV